MQIFVTDMNAEDLGGEAVVQVILRLNAAEGQALDQLRGDYCERMEWVERQFVDLLEISNPDRAAKLTANMEVDPS